MWAIIILVYLIFAAVILALTFRKRKLYPVEVTKKKYICWGIVAIAGIFVSIGILTMLWFLVFPYFQKLLFGKDAIIFFSFMEFADFSIIKLLLIDFVGMFLSLISFYMIIVFQHNTPVWVFYRDLKERSLKLPNFNEPTDFSDENIQRVTKRLNVFLRSLAIFCLVFFLLGGLSLLSYEKFENNEIIRTSYGSFRKSVYGYEDIEKVEISINRSPNGKNPVLHYFIYFNDGNEMEISYEKLIALHTLLKDKNAPFVYLPYTERQYEELINRYIGAKREAYEFVLSDNLNQGPLT